MAVAAVLRFYQIGGQSLWIDEAYSLEQARLPWRVLLAPDGYMEIHPPFYYLMLKPFYELASGSSEWFEAILRMPSALFSILTVPALFYVASILYDRATAILASTMLAVSIFAIWYAQEVRMYSLGMLLVTLQVGIAVHVTGGRCSWLAWLLLCLVSAAAVLTHWYAVAIWPVLAALAVARRGGKALLSWALVAACVAVPAGVYLLPRMAHGRGGEMAGGSGLKNLAFTAWSFWVGYSGGPSVIDLHRRHLWTVVSPFLPSMAILGLCGLVAAVCIVCLLRRREARPQTLLVLSWFLICLLGPFLLAVATGRVHNARYSFAAFPAGILLLAAAIRHTQSQWRAHLVLAAYLLSQLWCLGNYYWKPYYAREDYRGAASYLLAHPQARGHLLLSMAARRTLAAYGVAGWEWRYYPPEEPWSEELRQAIADRPDRLGEILHLTGDRWYDGENRIGDYLRANLAVEGVVRWQGLCLRMYGSASAGDRDSAD